MFYPMRTAWPMRDPLMAIQATGHAGRVRHDEHSRGTLNGRPAADHAALQQQIPTIWPSYEAYAVLGAHLPLPLFSFLSFILFCFDVCLFTSAKYGGKKVFFFLHLLEIFIHFSRKSVRCKFKLKNKIYKDIIFVLIFLFCCDFFKFLRFSIF